ncbi:ProQ/FinO family protein [Pigmentiphaga soli]|uniref:ProQ/FinO family protein n=1 Tax=Pigmentiphaga soli TaxID=1007095 RepID=A0ABP8HEC3_9BURK
MQVLGKTMGFEQLAALRDMLAKQAADERRQQAKQHPRPAKGGDKARDARSGPPANKGRPPGRPAARARPADAPAQPPRDPLLVAIGRLQQHFPKAFPKRPAPRVPLKLGIIDDLYAHASKLRLSQDEIKQAVATWCSVQRYWVCLTKDAVRVDLAGEPAGKVTPAEATHARFLAHRQRRQKAQAEKGAAAQQGPSPESPGQTAGQAEPAQSEPVQAESAQAGPAHAEPAHAEPSRTEPAEDTAKPE